MEFVCPKCGHKQEGGDECVRCGVIFSRYRGIRRRPEPKPKVAVEASKPSTLRQAFRVFRWVSLAAILIAILLALQQPAIPPVAQDPFAGQRVQRKLEETQRAVSSGQPHVLKLNEAEVNSWLGDNLVLANDLPPDVEDIVGREATLEEVQSTVRNLQVRIVEDELNAHVIFDFHGKDLVLEIRGQLAVADGLLRLTPTGGRLGALPIPRAALDRAVARVFESPENREKFRVPEHIGDVRVQDGEIRVTYK